jgi:PIN domain nuclease of toxin-antitoxin system
LGIEPVILLDTAAWIWLATESSKLSAAALKAIRSSDTKLVSAISAWEVGMLVAKGRIGLDRPIDRWVEDALRIPGVEPVSVDVTVGLMATKLPGEAPADPADRIVVATSLIKGCPIVTPDRRLREYPFVPTIW